MKNFNYETAINQLVLDKKRVLNTQIKYELIPKWTESKGFFELFLPYLKIIGDSREQDVWVKKACEHYGIAFETAKKDTALGTENLKEGDYTFCVVFGNKTYNYLGDVAYERKGSIAEFYGNCTKWNKEKKVSDRQRIKRELNRFEEKKYRKVVLMLEFGECITDTIDQTFEYRTPHGIEKKDTKNICYSALMSWKQPNNNSFEILQSSNRKKLFWLFLQDCYYFFRNEIRNECISKHLIEKGE